MRALKFLLQRSQVRLKALLDGEYRYGMRWREAGMRAAPPQLEAVQLASLNKLLAHFRALPAVQQKRGLP